MSIVGQGAFALVPSASSPEGLTKRLLALRAEIDAILVELVSHAMATAQQGGAMPAVTVAPAALAEVSVPDQTVARAAPEQTNDAAPIVPVSDERPQPECCDTAEPEAVGEPANVAVDPAADPEAPELNDAVAPELLVADAVATEPAGQHELTSPSQVEEARADISELVPVAEVDTDGTEHIGNTSPAPEPQASLTDEAPDLASSPATDVTAADHQEQDVTSVMLAASEPVAEAAENESHAEESAGLADAVPLLTALPIAPTDNAKSEAEVPAATVEAPAEATIIDFQQRQRKQAGLVAGAPMAAHSRPMRTGRRLAAKIAASILVIVTAASAMVAADRNAFGMAQSLPWMTQTPSAPTGIEWLLQRLRDGMTRQSE